jgi:hypothetical protein
MTTPLSLYTNLIDYCHAHSDEAIVKKYSRYFKEGYDACGVDKERFRKVK